MRSNKRLNLGLPVAAALALQLSLTAARAADFAAGGLQYAVPAGWTAETRDHALTLVGPNEDSFVVFSVLQPANDRAIRNQVGQLLARMLADVAVADSGEAVKAGGMPALAFSGTGSSDATSVAFRVLVVRPASRSPVMVLAYTAQENFAAQQTVFETLFQSLRPQH